MVHFGFTTAGKSVWACYPLNITEVLVFREEIQPKIFNGKRWTINLNGQRIQNQGQTSSLKRPRAAEIGILPFPIIGKALMPFKRLHMDGVYRTRIENTAPAHVFFISFYVIILSKEY
jgi:hypothetical protein